MTDRWGKSAAPIVNRSNGLNPSSFHKKIRYGKKQSRAEMQLNELLCQVSKNEVMQKRKEYSSEQNTRRNVFNDITSLTTFPLQELALSHWEELTEQYLNGDVFRATKKQKICASAGRENYIAEFRSTQTSLWSLEPRIFSEEKSATGKRRYIVGHLGRFLQQYWRERDARSRHCYELIKEKTPCRMYFDLEFCKISNQISSVESDMLMTEFILELCTEFQLVHDIKINRSCIVDLDSTTEKKFSRHLIVHLPEQQLFVDARAAGVFAKTFVERLAHELSIGTLSQRRQTLAKHLFVKQKNDRQTCFVDLGVYTRNRLFRIMGSAKFGKPSSAALRIAAANEFPFPDGFDNSKFYIVDKQVELEDPNERDLASFRAALSWDAHADALAATLVVPINVSKIKNFIGKSTHDEDSITALVTSVSLAHRSTTSSKKSISSIRNSNGQSPMPKLDKYFLSTLGRRGGTQGKIRAWSIECVANDRAKSNGYFLTYQMCENRWCEFISRSHKSNNIFWTIDLGNKSCWQQCHDPDCRQGGFRGQPIQLNLPADVSSEVEDFILEQEIAAIDEDEVLKGKMAAESVLDFDDEKFDKELCNIVI